MWLMKIVLYYLSVYVLVYNFMWYWNNYWFLLMINITLLRSICHVICKVRNVIFFRDIENILHHLLYNNCWCVNDLMSNCHLLCLFDTCYCLMWNIVFNIQLLNLFKHVQCGIYIYSYQLNVYISLSQIRERFCVKFCKNTGDCIVKISILFY